MFSAYLQSFVKAASLSRINHILLFCLGFDLDDVEDEDEDDPEIKSDPVYLMDLQVFLSSPSIVQMFFFCFISQNSD